MIYRQEVCWSGSQLTTSNAAWALKLCKSSTLYNELICERMQLLECKHQSIDLWCICFGVEWRGEHWLPMFLILKHGGGALQSCDHMEPLQERLIVKTLKLLGHQHPSAKLVPLYKLFTQSSPGMRRFYITPLPIHSKNKVEPPPCVTLQNPRVSLWFMCNWLDEWPSRSTNPSKRRLIKRHRRPWLKTSQISFI